MNNGPILEYPGHDYKRTAVIVGVIVLTVIAIILFIGPSNILQMLHLKDLETDVTVPVIDPHQKPMITVRELRPYVVGRALNPYMLWGEYAFYMSSEDVYNAVYVFPVEKAEFELEVRLENGTVTSAILTDHVTLDRMDLTRGVDGPMYDQFVRLYERTEAVSEAAPAEP
ncbi:MAG: hypothetical protein MJ192_03895 [Clostridia bacterium]|nr:hypothetical protein [Clostridia bacterium]